MTKATKTQEAEHPAPGIKTAADVSIGLCSCGTVWMQLYDNEGNVFAAAGWKPSVAFDVSEKIFEEVEAFVMLMKSGAGEKPN